jgi:hypothetical protein
MEVSLRAKANIIISKEVVPRFTNYRIALERLIDCVLIDGKIVG